VVLCDTGNGRSRCRGAGRCRCVFHEQVNLSRVSTDWPRLPGGGLPAVGRRDAARRNVAGRLRRCSGGGRQGGFSGLGLRWWLQW
jgi:hypothetical protein